MKNIPFTGRMKYHSNVINEFPNRRTRRYKLNSVPSSVKIGAKSVGTSAPIRSVKQLS